jgi:hypothetical protein
VRKLISHGNTEITEETKVFRVLRASVANIMLKHAQKEEAEYFASKIHFSAA